MTTGVASARAWRRDIPAIAAAFTVLAAGAAFRRVFTWADVAGPVIVAALLGVVGGVAARRALTPPGAGAGSDADADGAGTGADAESPGTGWLGSSPRSEAAIWGAHVVATVSIVAATFVSVVVTAAVFASPRSRSFGETISQGVGSLFDGWSRILTTSVPVPPSPDRLPLAAGLVAVAAAWAVLAASRSQPGVDALLPAGLVLCTALLLGVHGPGSLAVVAGPPLALGAAYLLVVSRPAGEGVVWVPPGRTAAAISTGAVVLAVSLAAGTHLPLATLRQPVDLRNTLSPPLDVGTSPNPIDELPAWRQAGRTVMFTATVDSTWLDAPANWRLVSLDLYDGTGWSTDAEATRAGNVLSPPPGVTTSLLGPEVHVVVRLGALAGPWIPTVGVPTAVSPGDLDFDPASSILLVPERPTGPFALSGRLSQPSRAALDAADIGSGASVAALTSVPACFPAALRSLAARAAAGFGRPDQQAVAVEQALATKGGFRLDSSALPGSSCARLSAFASTRSGTEEQFATAFALMVRSVGLPSRLAVGFTPGAIDPTRRQTVVSGSDATVWPEVDLGRIGWVAFAPAAPSNRGGPGNGGEPGNGAGAGRAAAGAAITVPEAQQGLNQVRQTVAGGRSGSSVPAGHAGGQAESHQKSGGSGIPWVLVVLLATAAAGAGVAAIRTVARRRRRALRRSAPDPVTRVLGAWSEVLESMAAFQVPVTSLTPTEVSDTAARLVPPAADASRQLAVLVDRAVYAGAADDALATQAWASSDSAVRALAQAVPASRRLRNLLVGTSRLARIGPRHMEPPRMHTGGASATSPPTPYTAPTTKQ